ncbi:hypothetical protein B0H19DRAFT_262086 [Mycena capillaripes]|nr:hypothetical protein B0H19DRAFT_262086 [Mycena capillaripes]
MGGYKLNAVLSCQSARFYKVEVFLAQAHSVFYLLLAMRSHPLGSAAVVPGDFVIALMFTINLILFNYIFHCSGSKYFPGVSPHSRVVHSGDGGHLPVGEEESRAWYTAESFWCRPHVQLPIYLGPSNFYCCNPSRLTRFHSLR